MEKRGRLLAAVATVVVVAVLLPSIGGGTQVHARPAPTLTSLGAPASGGRTIPVGSYPFGITFDPVNGYLYVTNFGSNNISVIDATTNRVVSTIPMPYGIGPIVADTQTGVVYTGDAVSTVYGINSSTDRIEWRISLVNAGCPYGCAPDPQTYDAANGDIYVTDTGNNNVSVIHGSTAAMWMPVGSGPNGAAYDSANGDIYISNEGSCLSCMNLTVINGSANRVVGQVSGSGGGPGVAYDGSNGEIFVCENGDQPGFANAVTVVNGATNQVVASIPISTACQAAVYDPVNDYVYITDRSAPGGRDQSNVTLVDPAANRIVLTLPAQLGPTGIAFDSANHKVYVADSDTNNITILPQIYRLTIDETGLPNGTNWSVTAEGTTFFSTTPSITFPEPNGTVNYTIGDVAGRPALPSSGSVIMAGGPKELNVTFSNSTSPGSSSSFLGFPGTTGYYLLGGFVVALVAAAVVVVVLTRRKRRAKPSPITPPPDGATDKAR